MPMFAFELGSRAWNPKAASSAVSIPTRSTRTPSTNLPEVNPRVDRTTRRPRMRPLFGLLDGVSVAIAVVIVDHARADVTVIVIIRIIDRRGAACQQCTQRHQCELQHSLHRKLLSHPPIYWGQYARKRFPQRHVRFCYGMTSDKRLQTHRHAPDAPALLHFGAMPLSASSLIAVSFFDRCASLMPRSTFGALVN